MNQAADIDSQQAASSLTANLSAVHGVKSPTLIGTPRAVGVSRLLALLRVGRRRVIYIARFCYWTAVHRSTQHVAWVLAHEGTTWN